MKRLLTALALLGAPSAAFASGGYVQDRVLNGASVSPSTVTASQCLRADSASSHFQAGPGCGSVEAVFNEASGDVDFRVESNGLVNALIVNAGVDGVGLNTASPGALLHLVSSSTTAGHPLFRADNNAGTELMRIRQDGRVGIGTASPQTLLDVDDAFQWGDGATKSTGSATGSLSLTANATLTLLGATGATPSAIAGAVLISSGSVVAQSTSATAGHFVFQVRDNAGTNLLRVNQDGGIVLAVDLPVSEGGTGASTLTDGGVLFGAGTGAITASAVLTNGQLLIGDGTTAPTLATLTATADETTVTNGAGTITIGIADPLIVGKGGTGVATLTDGGVLFGAGTGALTASAVLTNGQLLIGDGTTAPTLATLTGTADEITVTNGAGTITLDIPDPLIVGKGGIGAATLTSRAVLLGNGTGAVLSYSTFTLTAAGNVGIGTASPATKLHLSSGAFLQDGNGIEATGYRIRVSSEDSTGIFVINGNGRVGVGVTNPANILSVNGATLPLFYGANTGGAGSANDGGLTLGSNASFYGRLSYEDGGNTRLDIINGYDAAGAEIRFIMREVGTDVIAMSILGSGNMGIGTVNPATRLHISSGTLTIDGNTALSSRMIGHSEWNGAAPSIASCGTGASITGSDSAGHVVIGTGGATVCAITFAAAFTNRPHCLAAAETEATLIRPVNATTSLTLTATLAAGTTVQYWCPGN